MRTDIYYNFIIFFANIFPSCAYFALKLGDMSLLIIFYCHTELQTDSMTSFRDIRGGGKIAPLIPLGICKNMIPYDGLRYSSSLLFDEWSQKTPGGVSLQLQHLSSDGHSLRYTHTLNTTEWICETLSLTITRQ